MPLCLHPIPTIGPKRCLNLLMKLHVSRDDNFIEELELNPQNMTKKMGLVEEGKVR